MGLCWAAHLFILNTEFWSPTCLDSIKVKTNYTPGWKQGVWQWLWAAWFGWMSTMRSRALAVCSMLGPNLYFIESTNWFAELTVSAALSTVEYSYAKITFGHTFPISLDFCIHSAYCSAPGPRVQFYCPLFNRHYSDPSVFVTLYLHQIHTTLYR